MEGEGLLKEVLMVLNTYFFYPSVFLLIYLGGFYIYLGNGYKYPYNPCLLGLVPFHFASWLYILNLVYFGYLY